MIESIVEIAPFLLCNLNLIKKEGGVYKRERKHNNSVLNI